MKNKRGSKLAFVDELLSITTPTECDVTELTALYSTAFGSNTTIYQKINLANPVAIENISGFDLLAKAVISSADTPFAESIRDIGATDGIMQGHEKFSHAAGAKCPYCKQELPTDYETAVDSVINTL